MTGSNQSSQPVRSKPEGNGNSFNDFQKKTMNSSQCDGQAAGQGNGQTSCWGDGQAAGQGDGQTSSRDDGQAAGQGEERKVPEKQDLWDRLTQIPPVRKLLEVPAVGRILNKETVLYVIVGVLTTLVDYAVFALVNELLKRGGTDVETSSTVATAVAWAAAVFFAYFTNKVYVFESHDWTVGVLVREILQFFGARVFSGLIVLLLMRLLVGLQMNEYLAKILTSVFNLVFNYVASKVLIFRKK